MKTYLVLYLIGSAIYTLGPYPDGADHVCETSAVELQERARNHWFDFQESVKVPIRAYDLIAKCEHSETRPKIDVDEVPLDFLPLPKRIK